MSQLLPFKLGAECYALELTDVQEVVENRTIHALPGGPAVILGAISFHGRIVPVIDLPLLLGFPVDSRAERIVVLTDEHGPVALAVDQLQPIISVDLAHSSLSQSEAEEDCIRGVFNQDGKMISLLDLEQLQRFFAQLCTDGG